MGPFAEWCDEVEEAVQGHILKLLSAIAESLPIACEAAAEIVPTHYASEERIAELLDKLGKKASAKFIRDKLPEGPRIRSGDQRLRMVLAEDRRRDHREASLACDRLR